MDNYLKIEEGLAAINQLYEFAIDPNKKPILFMAALHYYSCVLASEKSFKEMFKSLEHIILDPYKRWR